MARKGEKAVNSRKEVLIQGKHAEQLLVLQQRQAQIQNQQNQLVLALRETQGGVRAIIGFYVGKGEQAVDYDAQRNMLSIEKLPEEEKK